MKNGVKIGMSFAQVLRAAPIPWIRNNGGPSPRTEQAHGIEAGLAISFCRDQQKRYRRAPIHFG